MSSASPRWSTAAARLRQLVQANAFPAGRLPSEPELAEQLGCARGTARRALAQLELEGLLIRRHGSGTYVNTAVQRIASRLEEVWDFAEMIRLAGHTPGVQHLETRLQLATEQEQARLGLPPGSEVIAVTNLFLADGRPVIHCLDVLPGALVRQAYAPEELHGPVYAFLQRRCQQSVSYNIAELCPVNARPALARVLGVRPGKALFYFEEVGYNPQHQAVLFSQEYYLPEIFNFQVVRRMMSASTERN
jgi:GntR family transcriptional regulator